MTPPMPTYTVTKAIDFCYGHRLLDYDGPCRNLHGHNARAVITLETERLDEQGMVRDFVDIKQVVKRWIDAELDHVMLLHKDDPFLPVMREHDERVYVMDVNPTAENIAKLVFDFVKDQGFPVTEVALWETESSCAMYRP